MKEIIKESASETGELKMQEIYLDTSLVYQIKRDEKAMYNLTKEQRVFFKDRY